MKNNLVNKTQNTGLWSIDSGQLKILVTGGLGYIGSHTVVELIQNGFEVEIIDDLSNSNLHVLDGIENITKVRPLFHQIDLKDKKAVQTIFLNKNFSGIIHFAASKAVGESNEKPLEYYENNIYGLLNLLNAIRDNNCNNLIFSSSCTVYGQADFLPIDENATLKMPESVYGKTKQMGEIIIQDFGKAMNVNSIFLRYFNPIGAHKSLEIGELPNGIPNNLIPFVTQTASGIRKKLMIFGNDYDTIDGTCIRDYIYVGDLANAHVKALNRLLENKNELQNECFNLGTGNGNSVLEVVSAFEKANNVNVPFEFAPRRKGDIVSAWANPNLAKEKLNWEANTPLDESLRTCWEWQKKIS